ncbi:ribosomal protein S18-alanine N-acetyltransferase [Tetragenococcus koreensis]|uniref:Ribosomal-protein-alanine acetyltransferase n=2 Tax=Tetragenococcus koreensis TaxID=290335 RepID=A0AAN4RKG4_9ENTE|nr:ribosomal protein S18-alanine N-acetyltransferase [Tetragenococcus koreensis]AYW44673.1 ribosomal-protein-alanine N-acetyltransferase [Tetragenococcus koreensis]MCF1584159.1 ribosomal protein S18-alanine N-acetyltransferase [Tetragenococcus koreensis]MCF1613708.1 ribosomal protein S18-alanine N-acetyltransferase [Tetragenococcus koreensis]MCF1618969.1 ribosomal protein S18-alanine N-acetyltransferase [Tetragenococcus koreensis]MCF1623486.1 ribosomal protein S18-alanine N-acetyltransferase [
MRLVNECFFPAEKLANCLFTLSRESYTFGSPWTQEQFKADICNEQSGYLVLEDTEILAYLCYHQFLDEMEIFNFAIAQKEQRKGYGHFLLENLNQIALTEQIKRIILEVRMSNQAAQKLYLKNGFDVINRRADYYVKPTEDALVMTKKVRPEKKNERIDIRN